MQSSINRTPSRVDVTSDKPNASDEEPGQDEPGDAIGSGARKEVTRAANNESFDGEVVASQARAARTGTS
jgi:hypothetical protein